MMFASLGAQKPRLLPLAIQWPSMAINGHSLRGLEDLRMQRCNFHVALNKAFMFVKTKKPTLLILDCGFQDRPSALRPMSTSV